MAFKYIIAICACPSTRLELAEKIKASSLEPIETNVVSLCYVDSKLPFVGLPIDSGIILGLVFSKNDSSRITKLSIEESKKIAASKGAHLLTDYWGGYLAVLGDAITGGVRIIREPTGAMPCYYMRFKEATVLSSDIQTLRDAGLFEGAVEWDQVRRHLLAHDLRSTSTAVTGLSELLPGTALCDHNGKTEFHSVWSPWNFCTPDTKLTPSETTERLRELCISCVTAWAGSFSNILSFVSGGLDSSIVTHAIGKSTTPFLAMTVSTNEARGDERAYARIAAEAASYRLLEERHDLEIVDVTRASSAHLPRPYGNVLVQSLEHLKRGVIKTRRADAFFTGLGGDNLFCNMQSASPLVDRLKTQGLSLGLLETLTDICRLTGCSLWEAIAMAIRRSTKPPNYIWGADSSYLSLSPNDPENGPSITLG